MNKDAKKMQLQLTCPHTCSSGFEQSVTALPSILPSDEDERRRERNRDLAYESMLDDEQEYGPIDNRPDDVGWRQ